MTALEAVERPAEPDAPTAEFFATFRRPATLTPERLLMLAVLENAITCCRRYAAARDPEERRWSHEAQEWLASSDRSFVFAFETICDALDVHPDYVRRLIERSNPTRAPFNRDRRASGRRRRTASARSLREASPSRSRMAG